MNWKAEYKQALETWKSLTPDNYMVNLGMPKSKKQANEYIESSLKFIRNIADEINLRIKKID